MLRMDYKGEEAIMIKVALRSTSYIVPFTVLNGLPQDILMKQVTENTSKQFIALGILVTNIPIDCTVIEPVF